MVTCEVFGRKRGTRGLQYKRTDTLINKILAYRIEDGEGRESLEDEETHTLETEIGATQTCASVEGFAIDQKACVSIFHPVSY